MVTSSFVVSCAIVFWTSVEEPTVLPIPIEVVESTSPKSAAAGTASSNVWGFALPES